MLTRTCGEVEREATNPKCQCMKKKDVTKITDAILSDDELRPEYDDTLLKNGIRGKYARQYAAGTNIVRLAPDVADAFPNEEAVNEALRFVLKLMEDTRHLGRHRD